MEIFQTIFVQIYEGQEQEKTAGKTRECQQRAVTIEKLKITTTTTTAQNL
jgi:hypothetical protein